MISNYGKTNLINSFVPAILITEMLTIFNLKSLSRFIITTLLTINAMALQSHGVPQLKPNLDRVTTSNNLQREMQSEWVKVKLKNVKLLILDRLLA